MLVRAKQIGVLGIGMLMSGMVGEAADVGSPAVTGWRGDGTGRYPNATPVTEWGYWPKSPNWGLRYQLNKPQAGDTGAIAKPVENHELLEWLVIGPFEPKDAAQALAEPFIPNEAGVAPSEGEAVGDLKWQKHVSVRHNTFNDNIDSEVIQLDTVVKGKPNGVAYAHAYFHSQMKGRIAFYLDYAKGARIWVNGKEVLNDPKAKAGTPANNYVCYAAAEHWKGELLMLGDNPNAKIPVDLDKGWNSILIKAPGWVNLKFVETRDVQYEKTNVVWVTKLPNWSDAMPIIVGEKIFLMAEPDRLVCINKADGKILWIREATFVDAASAEDKKRFAQFQELATLNETLKKTESDGERVPIRRKMNDLLHEVDDADMKSNADYQDIYKLQATLKDAKTSEADKAQAVRDIKAKLAALKCAREVNPLYQVVEPIEAQMKKPETSEVDRLAMEKKLQDFMAKLGPKPKYLLHPGSHIGGTGFSCPTPISDGKRVWVLENGFGIAACYDLDGNTKWVQLLTDMGDPGAFHNNNPVLVDGKLIALRGSIMRAFDAENGSVVWTSSDLRKQVGVDMWHGFGTGANFSSSPCVFKIGDVPYVFFNSAVVRVSDGKVLAQVHLDLDGNVRSTPFVSGDAIYVAGNSAMHRLPIPAEAKEGMVLAKASNGKWESGDISFYSSPLVHDGLLYGVRQNGKLWVYDAMSLADVYTQMLDVESYSDYDRPGVVASVALGGKYIFVLDNQGTGIVVEPGRTFKQVARNRLAYCVERIWNYDPDEIFQTAPIFERDRMYIRGEQNLYCIGKK